MSEKLKHQEARETKEKGSNVKITIKFIRHGERDLVGNLQDYGREETKKLARDSGLKKEDFDAVKAYGSSAGPKVEIEDEIDMARATETAHIYVKEIFGDDAFKTRSRGILSYETLKSEPPYDHRALYDSYIPENFDELDAGGKTTASKAANEKTIDHLIDLDTEKAIAYKKEIAGSFSEIIEHQSKVAGRLNSGSNVLEPTGSHGGLMELILQYAMVREDEEGNKIIGFDHLSEIGGDIDPSEAFDVLVQTDENGELGDYELSFDDKEKRPTGKIYLDKERVHELAEFYNELHKND